MKMRERHNDERKGDATVAGGGGGGSVQDNISQKNTSRRRKEIPNCALIKIEMKCQGMNAGSTAAAK